MSEKQEGSRNVSNAFQKEDLVAEEELKPDREALLRKVRELEAASERAEKRRNETIKKFHRDKEKNRKSYWDYCVLPVTKAFIFATIVGFVFTSGFKLQNAKYGLIFGTGWALSKSIPCFGIKTDV